MGRGFVIYLLTCIITLAFGIIFSNVFILFLFLVFLLAPFVSKLLMKFDAKNSQIKIYSLSDGIQDNEVLLYLDITSKNHDILAQGLLYLTFEITYHKYGEARKRQLKVPVSKKQGTIKITTLPDLCSVVSVKCISAESEDMLGIIKTVLPPAPTFYFTVFPKPLSLSITGLKRSLVSTYSEASQMSKKGSDLTDIRELDAYKPGDSVKAIHWKLSSKLDKPLIKIGSDSTGLKTLVLINLEKSGTAEDIALENRILCSLLQLGFTISTQLIENNIDHRICSVSSDGLDFYDIFNYDDEISAQRDILSSPIPSSGAGGINHLLFDKDISSYSKIICVCCQNSADDTKKLFPFCDVTAVVISPDTQKTKITKIETGKIIELPFDDIQNKQYNIEI